VAAQVIGGVLGTLLAHVMFDLSVFQVSATARTGPAQWVSELVATFALVLTILGTIRAKPEAVPVAVALVITAAYWFTASTSFANPAVTIARALSNTFTGIMPGDVPAFILAQLLGAGLAVITAERVFGWVRLPDEAATLAPAEHDERSQRKSMGEGHRYGSAVFESTFPALQTRSLPRTSRLRLVRPLHSWKDSSRFGRLTGGN
jgi:hypothetical protein